MRRVVFFSIWAAVIVIYGDKEIMSGVCKASKSLTMMVSIGWFSNYILAPLLIVTQ